MTEPRPSAGSILAAGALTALFGGAGLLIASGHLALRGHSIALAAGVGAGLVGVGVLGLRPLVGKSTAIAAALWAAALWFVLPLFTGALPSDALVAGIDVVQGESPAPEVVVAAPPSEAEPSVVAVAPAVDPDDGSDGADPEAPADDVIVLPYEGEGRRMRVRVTLSGPRGDVDAWMLFDTGATFTTLDRATLDRLGLRADGPELVLNTANGPVTSNLALLPTLWLDEAAADGVSIATCEACSSREYVGLLGLNVTGRYRVSIDHDAREVELRPLPVDDRTVDVSRWLVLSGRARTYPGIKTQVEVTGENLSARPIREATATVSCRTGEFAVQLDDIAPGTSASTRIDLPGAQDCERFTLELLSARW